MVNSSDRFVIRFAVHLPPVYRANFLAELIENYSATTRELSDGSYEIVSLKSAKSGAIFDMLSQEVSRGAIVIEA